WAVATATIALIVGAFHLFDGMKPLRYWEQLSISVLVLVLAFGGAWMIWDLQKHLANTRRALDRFDKRPWWRGMSIAFGLQIAQVGSAIIVLYSLWRHQGHGLEMMVPY